MTTDPLSCYHQDGHNGFTPKAAWRRIENGVAQRKQDAFAQSLSRHILVGLF